MNSIIGLIIGVLQITLLDLVLSADNIGVIALATKNLPESYRKKASVLGISGAVGLRIFFACIVTYIMMVQWLPIKLIGGLLLVKITWDLMKAQDESDEGEVRAESRFMAAVFSIIVADVSMSIDNVLAIGASAHGSVFLVVFGILLNIPILFFGSKIVGDLMRKYNIVVYIGAAVLAHTSFAMILEDRFLEPYINHSIKVVIPLLAGVLTLAYGFYEVSKSKVAVQQEKM